MSSTVYSFIGFSPAERTEAMKTLDDVIEYKTRNKEAAEESRGWDLADQEKYTRKLKPLVDAIAASQGEVLKYRTAADINEASRELADSRAMLGRSLDLAEQSPNDAGLAALVNMYALQAGYADSKFNYLQKARDLSRAKSEDARFNALGALEEARDTLADSLSAFESIQIPIGFNQTVSVYRAPHKGEILPGAALQVNPNPEDDKNEKIQAESSNAPSALGDSFPKLRGSPDVRTLKLAEGKPEDEPQGKVRSVVLTKTGWAGRLMELRPADGIPVGFNTEATPGMLNIASLRESADDPAVEMVLTSGDGKNAAHVSFFKGGRLFKMKIQADDGSIIDIDVRGQTGRDFIFAMLTGKVIGLGFDDLRRVIELHVNVFGGWGLKFWNMANAADLPDSTQDIVSNIHYKDVIRTFLTENKDVGEGVKTRKIAAKKPKRLTLGVSGQYGDITIDTASLMNDNTIIAHDAAGKSVMNEPATPGMKQLLTKRVMSATVDKAASGTRKQYKKINKLAGNSGIYTPPGRKTAIAKPKAPIKAVKDTTASGIVIVGDTADLVKRLKVACGVFDAGNRGKMNIQLITELASQLRKNKAITAAEHKKILEKYK